MRKGLYAFTKPNIVSMRVSDDEMETIKQLMEATNLKTSDIMRKAFQMLNEQFKETGEWENPCAGGSPGQEGAESSLRI